MVEHYSPRPMNRRSMVRHDDELMHYGIKGMKKGVRKDRLKPGVGPLKPTYHTKKNVHTKRGWIHDTKTDYTYGKSPYGTGMAKWEHRKVTSKFRKDMRDLGRSYVSKIKSKTSAYSSAFKKRASELRSRVNSFFGNARKQLTR